MHSLAHNLRVDEGATETIRILFVHAGSEQELCRILSQGGHEALAVPASDGPSRFVGVFVPDLIVVAVALDAGADDCLGTPLNVAELFARLYATVRFRASARRGPAEPQSRTASP